MKSKAFYLIVLFFTVFPFFGQGQTKKSNYLDETEKTFRLNNTSKNEDYIIEIKDGTERFELKINSTIYSGKLIVEFFDSKNVKQGDFTIEANSRSKDKSMTSGNLSKSFLEPESGKWKVKIISSNVDGGITINSMVLE